MIKKSGRKLVKNCSWALLTVTLVASLLTGCGPSAEDLAAVDYTPFIRDDWEVSTPK
jgi:hypothetical protein